MEIAVVAPGRIGQMGDTRTAFAIWLDGEITRRRSNPNKMAAILGVSPNTIGGWLKRGVVPDKATLERIAPQLGMTTDELVSIAYTSGSVADTSARAEYQRRASEFDELIDKLIDLREWFRRNPDVPADQS